VKFLLKRADAKLTGIYMKDSLEVAEDMERTERLDRAGKSRSTKGQSVSRRRESYNREKARSGVGKAATAVIAAAAICLTAVMLVIYNTGVSMKEMNATPTGGMPINLSASSEPQAVYADTEGQDFVQLSDPFLVLVNDQVALPSDWQVTPAFIGEETVDNRIYDQLKAMFDAAGQDNIWLWVASGYRSVDEQEGVLQREIRLHMDNDGMSEEEARELSLRTIARPGHSEHHTGLVVDLNDVSDGFEETEAYRWLSENAAEYGFVQRYRSDKVEITGIDNESWHYRYVGRENALEMQRLDMCLEEYVEYLKGQGVR